MNTIGQNIAVFRKQKGLTQEALASAIGVSAQSVSKWENNANMPDIMLLPVIADIFNVSVDALFGRQKTSVSDNPEDSIEVCCDALLESIMSGLYCPDEDVSFEDSLKRYKKALKNDTRTRTAIIQKCGIVYYRDEIGGIILKKPKNRWCELFDDNNAADVLEILSKKDFRVALSEIIKTQKTTFTIASLCRDSGIENGAELEEYLIRSGLFSARTVDLGEEQVTVYELAQGQRLFLLFALLTYAAEYNKYQDVYRGYLGDGGYYFA